MPTRATPDRCEMCGKRSATLYCEQCLPSRNRVTEEKIAANRRAIIRAANEASSLRLLLNEGR